MNSKLPDDDDTGNTDLPDAGPADRQQGPKGRKPRWQDRKQIAAIHTHFNIFRDLNGDQEGEVTVDEQLKAMERYIRWHRRQVEVGLKLYDQLRRLKNFQEGITDVSKAS